VGTILLLAKIVVIELPSSILTPSPKAASESVKQEPIVQTKTIIEKETTTVVQTAQKEIFIPIGSGLSKKKDFTNINGLEVTIDTSKYSIIESVVFEATIWTEGGNGRGYARLINLTDNNPFVESEVSSSSYNGEFTSSGNIPIPPGSRRYGIQAKSDIENFPVHVENARIKITLK